MTIVLLMQTLFFADGGIITLGANIFSMAVIGGLSFFIVKLIAGNSTKGKHFVGQGLSEHTAPYNAMAFVLEGDIEITIGGEGEVVILPVNKPHAVIANNEIFIGRSFVFRS